MTVPPPKLSPRPDIPPELEDEPISGLMRAAGYVKTWVVLVAAIVTGLGTVLAGGFTVMYAVKGWAAEAGAAKAVDAGVVAGEALRLAQETRAELAQHVEEDRKAKQALLDELRYQDLQRRETQLDMRALADKMDSGRTPNRLLRAPAPLRDGGPP